MLIRLAVAAGAALALAGCSGENSPAFETGDLATLVLNPGDGPAGLVYGAEQSGAGFLEKEGAESRASLAAIREFGFEADYGSAFFSTSPLLLAKQEGAVFAESIALLFADGSGATKALAFFEQRQRKSGKHVSEVSAAGFGEEGWGLHGTFFPGAPPTYFYGWRRGNAMFVFVIAGSPQAVDEEAARAFVLTLDENAARLN